jgi:DNA-binding NarL/FixJ family response regulator
LLVRRDDARAAYSPRERDAIAFARAGYTNKRVAIELGISEATACEVFVAAARKLGVRSRLDLVRVFGGSAPGEGVMAAPPEGLEISSCIWHGEDCLLLTFPSKKPKWPRGLTAAERVVAAMLIEGASTAAIARCRQTSERTVANQVASILRKAGSASRLELASCVFR